MRSLWIILGLLGLAIAGFLAWLPLPGLWWVSTDRQSDPVRAAPGSPSAEHTDGVAAGGTGSALGDGTETGSQQETGAGTRELVDAQPSYGERRVLTGRVVLPPGTPHDERLVVVITRLRRGGETLRIEPDPQGHFHVPLDEATRRLRVELDSHHLVLDKPLRVNLAEHEGELLIEPWLAGRILGRVELPPGGERWRSEVVGTWVQLNTRTAVGWSAGSSGTNVSESLGFEVKGLRPGEGYGLTIRSTPLGEASAGGPDGPALRLLPGEDLSIVLRFPLLPAAVTGRLEWGPEVPIDGVRRRFELSVYDGFEVAVWQTRKEVGPDETIRLSRDHTTGSVDPDGSFLVGPLAAGPATLRAVAPDCLPVELDLRPLLEGEERDVGTVELKLGATLRGQVVLEDGTPASGAHIRLDDPTSAPRPAFYGRVYLHDVNYCVSDAGGGFELSGLGPGPYTVVAEHSDDAGINRTRRLHGLGPSDGGLVVELRQPPWVRGVVLLSDGHSAPDGTRVWASCDEPGLRELGLGLGLAETRAGRFEFDDLFPGRWRIEVGTSGCRRGNESLAAALPHATVKAVAAREIAWSTAERTLRGQPVGSVRHAAALVVDIGPSPGSPSGPARGGPLSTCQGAACWRLRVLQRSLDQYTVGGGVEPRSRPRQSCIGYSEGTVLRGA